MKFTASAVLFFIVFGCANAQIVKVSNSSPDEIEMALLSEYDTDSVFVWDEEEFDYEVMYEIDDEDLMDDYWLFDEFDEFIPEDKVKR